MPHRFGAGEAPEGTEVALKRSIQTSRASVHELDVQATRDSRIVVMHEPRVDLCTERTGNVSDFTLEELKRMDFGYRFTPDGGKTFPYRGQGLQIMTMRELLEAYPEQCFNIELKPESGHAVEEFAQDLRDAGAEDRCCVGSLNDGVAERLAKALPWTVHFAPYGKVLAYFSAFSKGERRPDMGPFLMLDVPYVFNKADFPAEVAHLHGYKIVTAAFLGAAHADGLRVAAWVVDDPSSILELAREGVDAIITDYPSAARKVLDAVQGNAS
jgi:glycerophosphoryl diester phosphodiesterase